MSDIRLSIIITSKDGYNKQLLRLKESLDRQDFPKKMYEVLVITEGDSESAKAIGIKRAKGRVIGIFADDNEIVNPRLLSMAYNSIKPENDKGLNTCYPMAYHYEPKDPILNRYFSLVGCNDPLPMYLMKNDRKSVLGWFVKQGNFPTMGDNGFFIQKQLIMQSDMDHYFHIDNVYDIRDRVKIALLPPWVWHRTGNSILGHFKKRFKYGLQHAFNPHRRWHMVEKSDRRNLLIFVMCSLTLIQPLILAIKGYKKQKDLAWFLHPLIMVLTTLTYALLMIRRAVCRKPRLSSVHTKGQN